MNEHFSMQEDQHTALEHLSKEELVRRVDALHRVNRFVTSMGNTAELLKAIMEVSEDVVDAEASSLMLYDPTSDELYFEIALGERGADVKGKIRLKTGEGIAGQAALTRQPINVPDASTDPRHAHRADSESRFVTRSLLAVPLISHDKLIGVVEVLNKRNSGSFTDADVAILEVIARQAAVAIENARLIEANLKAERLAAIGEAVAGLAHYVKNIVAGIMGSVDLIDTALVRNEPRVLGISWPILKKNVEKISSLVQDMLSYSKRRTASPSPKPCDVRDLLAEMVTSQQAYAAQHNADIVLEGADNLPKLTLDSGSLHHCVLNLIINSIEAAVPDRARRIVVKARWNEDTRELTVAVADNGCGIPAELQEKILEPFFSTKGSRGTGLGLAVTRKIVEENGGRLAVESQQGVGTTITISWACNRV